MSIVHQGSAATAAQLAPTQRRDCGATEIPSSVDVERMLRADRTRFTHFSTVAAGLAAAWRATARETAP